MLSEVVGRVPRPFRIGRPAHPDRGAAPGQRAWGQARPPFGADVWAEGVGTQGACANGVRERTAYGGRAGLDGGHPRDDHGSWAGRPRHVRRELTRSTDSAVVSVDA